MKKPPFPTGFLLVVAFLSNHALAPTWAAPVEQKATSPDVPVRAPFFGGEALPTPPQQNAPWSHDSDAFSNAAEALFAQGLADPRGLEYREIEIAVGNPWNGGGFPVKTHGWVLPADGKDGQFAVAWNGLVYPVVSVGNAADLQKDFAPAPKAASSFEGGFQQASEGSSVDFRSPTPLKIALLSRLGATAIVQRLIKTARADSKSDPYLDVARDWAWFAFERAVCAHERGDDYLALVYARLLTRVQPLVEAEAKRRGLQPDTDFRDRRLPYLPFLRQLPDLLADSQRRVANPKTRATPPKERDIAALIDDLENVDARQWGQPGGVSLAGDERVQALVKRGNEVVQPLISAFESDDRLTRSVSFGRDFFRDRNLISVSDAAYAALVDLLRTELDTSSKDGKPFSRTEMAAQIRAYWAKMGKLPPAERFYLTLKDDQAGKDQWLQAAANIVQPADVESHGGWTTVPNRKAGQKVALRGESLRDRRTPSVSQLLAKRSDAIAAVRTHSSDDSFLYIDAGQMALYLAAWDKKAAIPTLRKRLTRAWSIGSQPDDVLASNGNPVEQFGTIIAQMTLARARCGDLTAYDEYAAWIRKADLKGVFFGSDELQKPLIQGAARPSIGHAIDYLFNSPKSPWSNILAPENGSWLTDFWPTPLALTAGFRKQALRALSNKTPVGSITFNPRSEWQSRMEADIQFKGSSIGFNGSNNDPDTPPPGQKRAFRVCDACAYFYSQYQHGPKFQLFWPQKKRDAGALACRQWLDAKSK